jgi:hypothetical protein
MVDVYPGRQGSSAREIAMADDSDDDNREEEDDDEDEDGGGGESEAEVSSRRRASLVQPRVSCNAGCNRCVRES